jgi:homocysteine S-methyltransferase
MTYLLDGGLSTELERIGARFDGPLWTGRTLIDDPGVIVQAHRNFVDAGADVIMTSSYQLSRQGFAEIGLTSGDADEALRLSVRTAREATSGSAARVAASMGPYGAVLHDGSDYRGNYGVSQHDLTRFHAERIEVLAAEEPDILVAETIPDLTEARALAEALGHTGIPTWVSFTSGDGSALWSGDAIEQAIAAVLAIPTLEAIGFNCVHPGLIPSLVTRARAVTDVAIAVYPNRGGQWNATTRGWDDQNPRRLDEWWDEWSTLGITYSGGCCGNDAHDISRLATRLRPAQGASE